MKSRVTWIAVLVAPWLALASLPAGATTKSWTLPDVCNPNAAFKNNRLVTTNSPYTNAPGSCTGTAELVKVQALSDTGTGGILQSAYIGDYGTGGLGVTSTAGRTTSPTGTLATGTLLDTTGGITTESTVAPDHAMDNNTNKESILLSFSANVSLRSLQLGYFNTDSDLSILRYTGTGAPGILPSYANLTSNGWSIVGNYADVGLSSLATGTTALSSYWLITAYNSVFGTGTNLSNGNDYVKLLSVTVDVPTIVKPSNGVPEPSSLLLVGIALLGLTQLRRRRAVI